MPFFPEDKYQKYLSNRALGYLLLNAAYGGRSDSVVALLKDEASIDTVDENTGMTALHIAVGRNNLEIARILVERGASFIADKQGRMPTTIAAECEVSEELCDFIVEAEAEAEARGKGV